MNNREIEVAVDRVLFNLKENHYSVDHIRADKGTAAIRYGSLQTLYDLTLSVVGRTENLEYTDLTRDEAQDLIVQYLRQQPLSPIEKASRRDAAKFRRMIADWQQARTPPKRASIPLGNGWSIALRRDEVFPEDPGNGTPAMVHGPFGVAATFWSAQAEGVASDKDWKQVDIPDNILSRIDRAEDAVAAYIDIVSAWKEKRDAA